MNKILLLLISILAISSASAAVMNIDSIFTQDTTILLDIQDITSLTITGTHLGNHSNATLITNQGEYRIAGFIGTVNFEEVCAQSCELEEEHATAIQLEVDGELYIDYIEYSTATEPIQQEQPLSQQGFSIQTTEKDYGYATGGTVSELIIDGTTYRVHTFTSSDTLQVADGTTEMEYLIVAGGGGGGISDDNQGAGAGGGAGGLLNGTTTASTGSLSVIVGQGGSGGDGAPRRNGLNGTNSSFNGLEAQGGGGGGGEDGPGPGNDGGSGGGGTNNDAVGSGTAGQGNDGGVGDFAVSDYHGGGGGGAGSAGGLTLNGRSGGDGLTININGSAVTYATGGRGGDSNSSTPTNGADGTDGLGGGGGGAYGNDVSGTNNLGGDGGDGIVIVRYPTYPDASGGTEEEKYIDGTYYRIHTFTGDGTLEVTKPGAMEYLIVAGGGGGGSRRAGGGGAGGLLEGSTNVTIGNKTVTVGAGGAGGTLGGDGAKGENSSFNGIQAEGGGAGDGTNDGGGDGGSGGGGGGSSLGGSGTAGQGNDGGAGNSDGGGGGGAGTAGEDETAGGIDGDGGNGTQSNITGTNTYYAGGGGGDVNGIGGLGGGGDGGGSSGNNAVDGTGGGGGACGFIDCPAGDGGNGIVIVRYQIAEPTASLSFVSPTPANGTRGFMNQPVINVTIESENLRTTTYEIDNTNHTIFNNSLVLMYNFDNLSALSETDIFVNDASLGNNNGAIIGGKSLEVSFDMVASGNSYHYEDLTSVTDYTIEADSCLEYQIYWERPSTQIGFDYSTANGSNLRSSGATDQNGLLTHPGTDLGEYAVSKWYYRNISLPSAQTGHVITQYDIASESDSTATRTAHIKDIRITDCAGTVRKSIYEGGTYTRSSHLSSSGSVNSFSTDYDNELQTTEGKYGGGIQFDGTNDYIDVADSFETAEGTIAFWIKPAQTITTGWSGNQRPFGKDGNYEARWNSADGVLTFDLGIADTLESTTVTWQAGTWYHIAITWDGTNEYLYVNNQLEDTGTQGFTPANTNTPFYIGRSPASGGTFNGTIDEFRIYDNALSKTEVEQLYKSNLKQINNTNWEFIITEEFNPGSHTYNVYANGVQAGERTLTALFPQPYFVITSNSSLVTNNNSNLYYDLSLAPANFWNNVTTSGGDIRVYTKQGEQLAREIVSINTTAETGSLFFNSANLSTSTDTQYIIHYGNSSLTEPDPASTYGKYNVWDENYLGVWHVSSQNTTHIEDSTRNLRHGQINGATLATGKVLEALSFDGSNDYVNISGLLGEPATGTLTAWLSLGASGADQDLISLGDSFAIRAYDSGSIQAFYRRSGGWIGTFEAFDLRSLGWKHISFTNDPSSSSQNIYIDGISESNTSHSFDIVYDLGSNTLIGKHGNGGTNYLDGDVDEIRISNVERSANWTQTEFNNQDDPASFWSTSTVYEGTTKVGGATNWTWDYVQPSSIVPVGGPNSWSWQESITSGLQIRGNATDWNWT